MAYYSALYFSHSVEIVILWKAVRPISENDRDTYGGGGDDDRGNNKDGGNTFRCPPKFCWIVA